MLFNQTHFYTVHIVTMVLAVLLPNHQRLVQHIAVLEVALAQRVILGLRCCLLSQAFALVLELLTLWDLRLKDSPSRFELVVGVGELDGVEALLEESILADALNVFDKSRLACEELVFATLLAPVLPSHELAIGHLLTLLLDSMSESKEHSLLESRLSDDFAEHLLLLLHILVPDRRNPLYESLTFRTLRTAPAHRKHEVLLGVVVLTIVPPAAEKVTHLELRLPTAHTVNHFDGAYFVGVDALSIEVDLAPKEEELLAHLMGYITVDDSVTLVVLVHNVEGFTVPKTQERALAVYYIVA